MIQLPPEIINDLSEVPLAADCYEPNGSGYRLTDAARKQIADANADLERVEAEGRAKVEAEKREADRLRIILRERVAANAVEVALLAAGVNPRALEIGAAYCLKHMPVQVIENSDGEFRVEVDGLPLEVAIGRWLATEEAALLLPKKATHESGPFASAIRRFKRGLH